ncbi:MAG: alpha-L-fucosidase [Capsulimonadaceae bacterium]|nr:alpha-L-fucosidase [Capsulimonadaceae bacterium]
MTSPNSIALPEIATGPFTQAPDSLRAFRCPEWFRDAKLGYWSHWGPQSVPMYGDWYARHLYVEGHDQYRHHLRVYGHPSKTGWKDIVPLWKAERFDPDALMSLFVEAGGKYFVGQAMHHDNFDNFDSAHNRWNSVNMGPKKDIVGLWKAAAAKRGLPFGLTEHLGASFNWWAPNKGADKTGPYAGVPYDGNDPAARDFYYDNGGYGIDQTWYTPNEAFHQHWFNRIKDVIDKYQPDLLYSDGGVPFEHWGRSIIAHLYNTSIALHGENRAVYNQKNTDPHVYTFGILDIERGQRQDIAEHPWQTDTSVGDWFYNVRDTYKTPSHVTESLVDIVSKNGNLLLNIPQRPDGTLDDECTFLLREIAKWIAVNGDGIYGTRPWTVSGEGPSTSPTGAFKEDAVAWTPEDFRFTSKANTVYAFEMRPPITETVVIRSLGSAKARRVAGVRVLGAGKAVYTQNADGLVVTMPQASLPVAPIGIAITLE